MKPITVTAKILSSVASVYIKLNSIHARGMHKCLYSVIFESVLLIGEHKTNPVTKPFVCVSRRNSYAVAATP